MANILRKLINKFRRKNKNEYVTGWSVPPPMVQEYRTSDSKGSPEEAVDIRIEKKPVDVVNDILIDEPVLDLTDLDRKIRVVKRRARILKEELNVETRNETLALNFLKARKKYKQCKKLFSWKVTTQEKIHDLLSKYKLRQVNFSGYHRNVPNEALDEIEKFLAAWKKIMDYDPALLLIIDDGGKEQKKDPILLAPSPFGNWFYVLGAWDKEVQYVDELVYNNK